MSDRRFRDSDYIRFDPCEGDRDGDIKCRTVGLVKARKEYPCFMGAEPLYGDNHTIKKGDTYRKETALVDSDFWGTYRVCVPCMDDWLTDLGLQPQAASAAPRTEPQGRIPAGRPNEQNEVSAQGFEEAGKP